MVNWDSPCHLFIQNRHARHIHAALLRVQYGLERSAFYLATNRDHQIRNMIDIDQIEQTHTGSQDRNALKCFPLLLFVVIDISNQIERTRAQGMIKFCKSLPSISSTDQ